MSRANLGTVLLSRMSVTETVDGTMRRELAGFEKRVRSIAGSDGRVRLLMSTPGVGAIVALTYVAAIDDPAFQIVEGGWGAFRTDPKEVSIR